MEHEHFSYPEALKYLAKKYNIEVIEDKDKNPLTTVVCGPPETLFHVVPSFVE